ncbi:MAG: hypothetical protein QOI36_2380 [Pseudonocardiales bacterium]|nr:hypothetical protein [Pseudonocardiales bacterium]
MLVALLIVGALAVRTGQLDQQRNTEMAQAQNLADPVATAPGTTAEHPGRFDVAAVLVADGQRQGVHSRHVTQRCRLGPLRPVGAHAGAARQPLGRLT